MSYSVRLTKQAQKDLKHNLVSAPHALQKTARELLTLLESDPLGRPPEFEALKGDLKGLYSRRLNRQHRLVYEINRDEQWVKVVSLWTHYHE